MTEPIKNFLYTVCGTTKAFTPLGSFLLLSCHSLLTLYFFLWKNQGRLLGTRRESFANNRFFISSIRLGLSSGGIGALYHDVLCFDFLQMTLDRVFFTLNCSLLSNL